ncbi:hypothetical protein EJ08DRAFT_694989 [Tothia fuscella]|uniref:Uncharacterized protein n=1 Tax=Tothia fuscella TaxID=1048955 RepID=A0A9P4NVA7_9PEZI|nr:hypothetical protein EJ08DRAFT_694989 [Tothia fuscella]
MEETITSILCGGQNGNWRNGFQQTEIMFKTEKSGEISAGVEFNWAILAEFTYKITDATTPKNQERNFDREPSEPTLPVEFDIDITLTKHISPLRNGDENNQYKYFNLELLGTPRTFHVKLEEGHFPLPEDLEWNARTGSSAKTPYTRGLKFDKSPYPPLSEWNDPSWIDMWKDWEDPEAKNIWEKVEFVDYDEKREKFGATPSTFGICGFGAGSGDGC